MLSPFSHRHLFAALLAAVLFTARFIGFGPAVFCTLISTVCLDVMDIVPRFGSAIHNSDGFERLTVFLVISLFAGSMARQRTLADSRAERSTREMAAIVEYSCDAIFSTHPDGTIASWNHAAEALFGYTAEEAVGEPIESFAPPERQAEVERNSAILRGGGRIAPYRTERMRKDGASLPVLLSVSPLRDRYGSIVGSSAIVRDLSGEKQSEEAIRRTEKLATAGRLAASIAHEINNPLESVVNLLYLARHDPGNASEYLMLAEREVGRVARLSQQALGFVRDAPAATTMDPALITDEVLQLFSTKLEGLSIQVMRRYRGRFEIMGFPGELRQLLANLLTNAADAMPGGGCLRVRVAPGHDWTNGREGVRIAVADTGTGIARQNLQKIFEPFYTTKKDAGTGLGLWVSLGIVEKHRGTMRVRSRCEGGHTGTVFFIFLPSQNETILAA
jgi:PAS domain S-box-containing protein